jgi:uncharacterized membrane protein
MQPLIAMIYSFLLGMLHGILPDEHTWPITFSYAIGGASGKQGMKAGLYFSSAFMVQRAFLSEVSYLALAPILRSPEINGIVYLVVGVVMSIAGFIVLRRNRYPHLHLLGHHHVEASGIKRSIGDEGLQGSPIPSVPPVKWTLIHGFIAGFGVGGFSLFINTVAAPAMPNAWLGFLPGVLFGLGTMIMLVIIGGLFGIALRRSGSLSEAEVRRIGAQTGGRTLFFGGLLFSLAGIATFVGIDRYLPVDFSYVLISLFMLMIVVPAFIYSLKEVLAARKESRPPGDAIHTDLHQAGQK